MRQVSLKGMIIHLNVMVTFVVTSYFCNKENLGTAQNFLFNLFTIYLAHFFTENFILILIHCKELILN